MKAISIKQPWASLICTPRIDNPNLGIKDIENRTWKTKFRGRVYIHASAQMAIFFKGKELAFTPEQWAVIPKQFSSKENRNNVFIPSAIIGEVDIIDCVINYDSIWAEKTPEESDLPFCRDCADSDGVCPHDNKKCDEPKVKPIYNWVLANPVLYDKPILNVKGKLSFWEIDKKEIIKNAYGRFYNPEIHHYSVSGYSSPESYSEEDFYYMMQEIEMEIGEFRCRPKILKHIFKNV